jgi:hypothetical protein
MQHTPRGALDTTPETLPCPMCSNSTQACFSQARKATQCMLCGGQPLRALDTTPAASHCITCALQSDQLQGDTTQCMLSAHVPQLTLHIARALDTTLVPQPHQRPTADDCMPSRRLQRRSTPPLKLLNQSSNFQPNSGTARETHTMHAVPLHSMRGARHHP